LALAEPGLRFSRSLAGDGLLIVEEGLAELARDLRARKLVLPLLRTAEEVVGSANLANMVALGALVGYTGLVSVPSMEEAIKELVEERFLAADLKAFRAGLGLVEGH